MGTAGGRNARQAAGLSCFAAIGRLWRTACGLMAELTSLLLSGGTEKQAWQIYLPGIAFGNRWWAERPPSRRLELPCSSDAFGGRPAAFTVPKAKSLLPAVRTACYYGLIFEFPDPTVLSGFSYGRKLEFLCFRRTGQVYRPEFPFPAGAVSLICSLLYLVLYLISCLIRFRPFFPAASLPRAVRPGLFLPLPHSGCPGPHTGGSGSGS